MVERYRPTVPPIDLPTWTPDELDKVGDVLEDHATAIEAESTDLEPRVAQNEADIILLDGRVAQNEADIAALSSGYAKMARLTGIAFDIHGTWTVLPFTDIQDPQPLNMTVNAVDNSFTPLVGGAWLVSIGVVMTGFTVHSTDKMVSLRAAYSGIFDYATCVIPRNNTDAYINASFLINVPAGGVGQPYQVGLFAHDGTPVLNGTLETVNISVIKQ